MKRGFLNTPQYKRAIEEAYAPRSPPGPEPSRQQKHSSLPHRTQDGGDKAAATEGVYVLSRVHLIIRDPNNGGYWGVSSAGIATTRSTKGEGLPPPRDGVSK